MPQTSHGQADLLALARELLYNFNLPMDAAQKLGVDRRLELVLPPYSDWLAKRAQSAPNSAPSTYGAGLGEPQTQERPA